jgi:hypothetical protein
MQLLPKEFNYHQPMTEVLPLLALTCPSLPRGERNSSISVRHTCETTLFACLSLFAALLTSCEKKTEITVYRVAKAPLEEAASTQMDAMPTNAGSPAAPGGMAPVASTTVTTPPNWEPQSLSQMRQASFVVKGENGATVDISLVSLGAAAGNVLENVNRWLSQLDQPPITEEKLARIAERLKTSISEVTIIDLAGLPKGADAAKDGRIIAAMASTNNSTLFFKMRGNDALTEAQKADFIKWVAAVCNAQTEDKSPQMAAMPPRDAAAPQIKWQTPKDWTEVPPSSMRYASFSASGANGDKIDISIVTFPGDGGSDADNVNRWRRQIGLGPLDDKAVAALIAPLQSSDTDFSTLDMTGKDSRVVAAWIRRDGRSWFLKMSGPNAAVEKEKPNFVKFIESVRF